MIYYLISFGIMMFIYLHERENVWEVKNNSKSKQVSRDGRSQLLDCFLLVRSLRVFPLKPRASLPSGRVSYHRMLFWSVRFLPWFSSWICSTSCSHVTREEFVIERYATLTIQFWASVERILAIWILYHWLIIVCISIH